MSAGHGRFVAVVNCMDGRVQESVSRFAKQKFSADYADTITEPGPIRALAEDPSGAESASIRRRLDISVIKHQAVGIVVAGHGDCAGNPRPRETQEIQLKGAVQTLKQWFPDVPVVPVWVRPEDWEVEELG
ncbi:MAG TPA: hypothetical protein PLO53_10140 [Candidatus Hydrogenedentes bacterium]|nr:hypothetical protein [Candidatus Hydrogenedentota bacterium]